MTAVIPLSGPPALPVLAAALGGAAVLVWPVRPSATARLARRVGSPVDRADRAAPRPALLRHLAALVPPRPPAPGQVDRAAIALLEALAAALRAGLSPAQALHHVAALGDFGDPAAAGADGAASGGPAGPALRRRIGRWRRARSRPDEMALLAARLAGHASTGARLEPVLRAEAERLASPALLALAAGWGMSERFGAPVVDVLDGLVGARRDAARTAAAVETALSAPRATASLLAALPFGGVVLGEVVGVSPLATLFGTSFGRVDLAAGLLATWGGRVWMRRLVRAVSSTP